MTLSTLFPTSSYNRGLLLSTAMLILQADLADTFKGPSDVKSLDVKVREVGRGFSLLKVLSYNETSTAPP